MFFTVKNNSYLRTATFLTIYAKRFSIALFINLLAILCVEFLTGDSDSK